jgi:hypothetical protein
MHPDLEGDDFYRTSAADIGTRISLLLVPSNGVHARMSIASSDRN